MTSLGLFFYAFLPPPLADSATCNDSFMFFEVGIPGFFLQAECAEIWDSGSRRLA